MTFLDNWKEFLVKAWSVKLYGFAVFLQIAGNVVPYLSDFVPWWATVLIILAGMFAQHVKQTGLSKEEAADVDYSEAQ